jgi:large subunit ribosomal protein L25
MTPPGRWAEGEIHMQFTELSADLRTHLGSGASRKLRRQGLLPAVLYGKSIEPVSLTVNEKEVDKILRTKLGKNSLIHINVKDGKDAKVMIKDFQGNALSRRLIHVDFLVVKEDQVIQVRVPVRIEGKPVGLQNGGLLEVTTRQLDLICNVGHIPEEIVVDVSALNVGDNIHLSDLKLPTGTKALEKHNPPIAAVHVPAKEEVVAAPAATDAAAAAAVPASSQKAEGEKAGEAKAGDAKAAPAKDAKAAPKK